MFSNRLTVLLLGGLVVTYLTRLSFIVLLPRDWLQGEFQRGLRYVPASVLAALLVPEILRPGGGFDAELLLPRMAASLIAGMTYWVSKSLWITIISGMISLWLIGGAF